MTKTICSEVIRNGCILNSAPDLNIGLPLNFCWLRNTNLVKFTDECLTCAEKHVLVKKSLQMLKILNSLQYEDVLGRTTMASATKMAASVNTFILADRRVTTKKNSEFL